MGGGSTSADVSQKKFRIEVTSAIEYKYFPVEDISAQVYTKMAAKQRQNFEENLEEQLAKIDPATLQYLRQLLAENVPAVRKIVQNVLDEPISQEMEKRLRKPLLPKPFQPRAPPRQRRARKSQELLREFYPFPPQNIRRETNYQNVILDLYDEAKNEGEESKGRRFIRWCFIRGLEKKPHTKLYGKYSRERSQAFYIRHVYSYQLRNIEDDTVIVYYTNHGSPWINDLSAAGKWLSEQETKRLDSDNIKRPSTKWEFVSFFNVDVKVVLDRQQPLLGTGPLPDWPRNLAHGWSMVTLNTYQDNLCVWRCIAVHRGARPDRSTTAARERAKRFFKLRSAPNDSPKTSLDELDRVEKHLNQGAAFFSDLLGIRVYEPVRVEGEVVWHLRRNPPAKLTNILTIGIYEGHAFVIKDIAKLANMYACLHCRARFTKACHLQRHTERCAQGKTVIDCPAERVEAPQTAFEKAFYPKHTAAPESLRWLEQEAARRKIHIHHAACGNGGERWVERAPLDGYDPKTRTVFQYHGCHWHRCRKCYLNDRDKNYYPQ